MRKKVASGPVSRIMSIAVERCSDRTRSFGNIWIYGCGTRNAKFIVLFFDHSLAAR